MYKQEITSTSSGFTTNHRIYPVSKKHKVTCMYVIFYQNTDHIAQPYSQSHLGHFLWAGSSSRIQLPAVPLLVHIKNRYKGTVKKQH